MRNALSVIILATFSTAAVAADLPTRPAPSVLVAAPPIFSWTGLYVGAQLGYELGSNLPLASSTALGPLASTSASENGVIGGAHVGYNLAMTRAPLNAAGLPAVFVLGTEGDVDGTSARATYGLGAIAGSRTPIVLASVRGRLGIAVDRTLFYATGGVAFGDFDRGYTNTLNGLTDMARGTRIGYTVGGGLERALTNNMSVRAEYRYTDFGRTYDTLAVSTGGGVVVRQRDTESRIQLGVSYRLGVAPAGIVARY